MFEDLVISLDCPAYIDGYYGTISILYTGKKEVCISHISIDVHLQTFNREEPLDKYRLVEEPYDPCIVRTRLLIDI